MSMLYLFLGDNINKLGGIYNVVMLSVPEL